MKRNSQRVLIKKPPRDSYTSLEAFIFGEALP